MRLHNLKSTINEGMFDSLKSFASGAMDKATDASGAGEQQLYIKDFQQKYARWVTQTQPGGTNAADIDIIVKFLKTQMRFTDQALKGVYQIAGIKPNPSPVAVKPAGALAAAPAGPDYTMFKDAAKFKSEWDKFVSQNKNYKLIADPRMLQLLKSIWMRTGGTKLESIIPLGAKLSGRELYSVNKLLESNGVTLESLGFRSTRTDGRFIIKEALPVKPARKPIPGLDRAKPTAATPGQPAQPTAATPGQPAQPTAATPGQPGQPAQPAPAPVQVQPVGNTVFADWQKFSDAWEGFQQADGSIAPQVRGVIKDILSTALKTVESVRNQPSSIAEGTVMDAGKIGQIWAEVVRSLYDSGSIESNPANNPLNRASAFMSALAGQKAIDTSPAAMQHKASGTTDTVPAGDFNSVIAGLTDLTAEEKKAVIDTINGLRQQ